MILKNRVRSGNFKMDGIDMPDPDNYIVAPKPLSSDAERIAGTGEAVVPYLRMVYEVTWEYKLLTQDDYDAIYQQYIVNTYQNKSMYHTLNTLDSNTGEALQSPHANSDGSINIYTQGDFVAPLYYYGDTDDFDWNTGNKRPAGKKRYYRDVKFVFISR